MYNNAGAAQAIWAIPLILTILFWQSDSCRSNRKATVNAQTQTADAGKGNEVVKGTWGGKGVGVEIAAEGATVEFDCAHGAIDQPFVADRGGRFDLKGTYEAERPGPQRAGPSSNARPARYSGSINGKSMTLTITLTDTNEIVGTFTLTRGAAAMIVKCL